MIKFLIYFYPCLKRFHLNFITLRISRLSSLKTKQNIFLFLYSKFLNLWVLFSIVSIFKWIFFQPFTFSLYVSLVLRWVSCKQHIEGSCFVSIRPVFVFWLGRSTHLRLRWLLISMIPLPFTLLFWVRVYTPFLCFLSREYPLQFVGELVWWCWVLSAVASL